MARIAAPALAHGAAPPAALARTPWAGAAAAANAHAPYLARLMSRRDDLLEDADENWPRRLVREALTTAATLASEPTPIAEGMRALRRAKDNVHLGVALADLAGVWSLGEVTGALTEFADAALRAALALAVREAAARGDFVQLPDIALHGPAPGLALIAMGKMGAGELNYSSDIDFSVFFEPETLAAHGAREPRVAAVKLVAPLVRALEEVTEDGYVFRTDLRLRPDPGATPVAVSIGAATHYYQTLGQNWERAAYIKARAAAGDRPCGEAFLKDLEGYVWRKHLDFAAIDDVKSIKRQILAAHGGGELREAAFDVKLGRGGIRDIELFAQTQQLILGGRNSRLRTPGTLAALDALVNAGAITHAASRALQESYVLFRNVEHRVQMMEDAHTHKIPADPELRASVAALCGFESLTSFDQAVVEARGMVAEIDRQLFGAASTLADPLGSLVFTGVEDHAETLETIRKLGFANPAFVSQSIRGWHHGRIRAMRSERARELLTILTPKLLRAFAATGDADQAFVRFADFFANLSAGVQVLALLEARPTFLELLARVLAAAPRLSHLLSRRPSLLDAMIEPRFVQPLARDESGARRAELGARLGSGLSFEQRLNETRRFHGEEIFRIGVQLLETAIDTQIAGRAYSDLADVCVAAMLDSVAAEVTARHGAPPGKYAVLALGKLGGRELADGSDLDLMMIYEAEENDVGAGEYFAKLTQRLVNALSALTEEGALYEIDTKLRPSGTKGPLAVRLSSFERYYEEEAWTWELQALTRLRFVAGDSGLGASAANIARQALARPRDREKLLADVALMRARMQRERRPFGVWDIKLAPGGLVDLEFMAQALQLTDAAREPSVLNANTGEAFASLGKAGALSREDADTAASAWALLTGLQQRIRLGGEGEFDPARAPGALLANLVRFAGAATVETLETRVLTAQAEVRAMFERLVGPLGDGTGALTR